MSDYIDFEQADQSSYDYKVDHSNGVVIDDYRADSPTVGGGTRDNANLLSKEGTSWKLTRDCRSWADPSLREIDGFTQYRLSTSGFIGIKSQISDETGVVYNAQPKMGFSKPFKIYQGHGHSSRYATVERRWVFKGVHLVVKFVNATEPSMEITSNWCARKFSLRQNGMEIANIRLSASGYRFKYNIAPGCDIPLIHLLVHLLGQIVTSSRY